MKTFIDQKAKATREYQKYIFDECVKYIQSPKADYVEFKAIENITPFPKIIETLCDFSDRKFIQEEVITPYQRRLATLSEVLTYTNKNLLPFCDFLTPKSETEDNLNITFFFTITKPEKLCIKAKKLGIEIAGSKVLNSEKKLRESCIKKNPLRICLAGKEIPIKEGTIQSRACEIMFARPLNAMVEAIDLVEGIYNEYDGVPKDKWKNINNAIYLVNKKVKEITGQQIFKSGKIRF